jgi:threonine dehydrogenase-like Zn-dependent dehydrogenase
MTRLFYTGGKRDIYEEEWKKPEITPDEIEVKSIFTGMCRSDLDMYCGTFQLLPKTIQGHESLGVVTKIGKNISGIEEGDYVATRGEPAFADYYNCKDRMFVKVPDANPKYIVEPVACAMNIAQSLLEDVTSKDDILLLGSGFLATVIYTTIERRCKNKVFVVGGANKDFWSMQENAELISANELLGRKFKYVIDVSEKPEYLNLNLYEERAKIVLAAEKHPGATLTFGQFLWNAVDIKFPSPRNHRFYDMMVSAVELIKYNELETSSLWTKSYDRESEIKLAFEEGVSRPAGYARGYVEWKK